MSATEAVPGTAAPKQRHMQSAAFRAAADTTRVTPTHYHIATANGLGRGLPE
jgi:hypothetical protein